MQDYLVGYGYAAIFLLAGVGFVLVTLAISNLLGPKKTSKEKLRPYESGEEPVGSAWVQFPVHFFIFGLLFVIFDVEALFVLVWAVLFKSLGFVGLIEMLIFIFVLLAGLVYAWKKGVLQWT